MTTETLMDGAIIDALFGALGQGDVDGALACLTPDARVWHGFDRIAHDRASIARDWAGFISHFPQSAVIDVHRQATPTGYVQQHVMVATTASGQKMAWPICIVVQVEGGLIARLDEYIDRAGKFDPDAE